MIKLVIADDEPLVQIGLRSMIDWSALNIEICGTASNGDAAWELVNEHRPEIVITDIQMPCSSGLELGKRCRDELGPLPVFIILTSFEDFQYAREAMSFRAVDYLVKIDLSPESLTEAVKKAVEQVNLIRQKHPEFQDTRQSLLLFQERFYIKLLNNLFESREQFRLQKEEFEISLDAGSYAASTVQFIRNPDPGNNPSGAVSDIPLNIYSQTLQMFQELLSKYISCRILALDTHFLAAVFLLDDSYTGDWKEQVRSALENTGKMLRNYYGVSYLASIGGLVHAVIPGSSSRTCQTALPSSSAMSALTQAPCAMYSACPFSATTSAGRSRSWTKTPCALRSTRSAPFWRRTISIFPRHWTQRPVSCILQ